jgi:O-methyltransferase
MLKNLVKTALHKIGLDVRRATAAPYGQPPVEFSARDEEIARYVVQRRLTMVSWERLFATITACKHAVNAEIDGDFVECGVWRGGNALAAKLTFESLGSDKKVWLFDTFTGMSEPADVDRAAFTGEAARDTFETKQKADHNEWCYASLEDVQRNFETAGVDLSRVRFVNGDVIETLGNDSNLPPAISVLRLDTDWYESTLAELRILYPRMSAGGSLLIDDFGYWEGARKAVEDYFATLAPPARPLLHYTDYTGRMGVKVV